MNIANLAMKMMVLKARAFERSTMDPMKAQEAVLFDYLKRNGQTEYGKKYNFAAIRSVAEYQKSVPMCNGDTLRPYIDRMLKGGRNILTSEDPIFFAITSGTTSRRKYIPVTGYSRYKKAELAGLWAYYIARDHPGIFDGKILAIISPEVESFTAKGVPYGAESGHAYRNLPAIIRNLYALPADVFNIADYESRYYCILRIAMEKDITTVATLNPSTIVLLCQKIRVWKEDIINDIARGAFREGLKIPEKTRFALERHIKPNPKRADGLKDILNEKGELLPKYFWPNMKLIECWKGGTVKLYLRELPPLFGDIPIRDFGCLSTEARSSIPMSDEGAGGVLAINTNFYEFVAKDEMGRRARRFLTCDQLEKGCEYFLVVTTPGGLFRYDIDDIVTVDGYFNKTPMIEFVQKGLYAVSITGEKLYESHVNEAVNKAAEKHKVLMKFFSACVRYGSPSRYIFLVEFDGDVPRDTKGSVLRTIEEELYARNEEYENIRKDGRLGSPILKVVKNGDFERYRQRKIAEGAHDGQFKVPELTSDQTFEKNFEAAEEIFMD